MSTHPKRPGKQAFHPKQAACGMYTIPSRQLPRTDRQPYKIDYQESS